MEKHWAIHELIDYFTFLPNELSEIGNKEGEIGTLYHQKITSPIFHN